MRLGFYDMANMAQISEVFVCIVVIWSRHWHAVYSFGVLLYMYATSTEHLKLHTGCAPCRVGRKKMTVELREGLFST